MEGEEKKAPGMWQKERRKVGRECCCHAAAQKRARSAQESVMKSVQMFMLARVRVAALRARAQYAVQVKRRVCKAKVRVYACARARMHTQNAVQQQQHGQQTNAKSMHACSSEMQNAKKMPCHAMKSDGGEEGWETNVQHRIRHKPTCRKGMKEMERKAVLLLLVATTRQCRTERQPVPACLSTLSSPSTPSVPVSKHAKNASAVLSVCLFQNAGSKAKAWQHANPMPHSKVCRVFPVFQNHSGKGHIRAGRYRVTCRRWWLKRNGAVEG